MAKSKESEAGYGVYYQKHYQINLALSLLFVVLGISGIASSILGETINKANLIGGMLVSSFGVLLLLDTMNTLLIISPKGLEYHRVGYTIFVQWEDVEKAEIRIYGGRHRYMLILRKSVVAARRLQKSLLRKTKGDVSIPLELFAFNWQKGHIGYLIRHYAPHAKIPNQSAMRIGKF